MFGFVERSDEALNFIVIALRHVGMNENRLLGRAIQSGLQLQLFRLQTVDLVANEHWIDAVFDGLNQLRNGLFRAFEFSPIGMQRCVVFVAKAVRVRRVFRANHLAEIRIHEPLAQRAEDNLFKFAFADREAVGARALISRGSASVLSGGNLRDATATLSAFEQEGKQLFRTALHRGLAHAVERSLFRLRTFPQFIVDDPKMWNISPHPF